MAIVTGDEVRDLLERIQARRGWRQKDVARHLGCTEFALSKMKRIGTMASTALALKALYYGVDLMPNPMDNKEETDERTEG